MPKDTDQNRLDSLLEISGRLNRVSDLRETMQVIADVAADLTNSEGSSILLFEEETQQLYFAAARADKSRTSDANQGSNREKRSGVGI